MARKSRKNRSKKNKTKKIMGKHELSSEYKK